MTSEVNDYSNCLLHLKECHGYTEGDLSDLLGISHEVVRFLSSPELVKNLNLLIAALKKDGYLYK